MFIRVLSTLGGLGRSALSARAAKLSVSSGVRGGAANAPWLWKSTDAGATQAICENKSLRETCFFLDDVLTIALPLSIVL